MLWVSLILIAILTNTSRAEEEMSTSDTNNNDLGITMEKMSLDVLPYSTSFIQEQFDELHKVKSKQQKVPLLI